MPYVWEDLRPIPEEELRSHFPNIVAHCLEQGFDVTRECIPVVPAQHYFMGGIKVDYQSRTSMAQLYAVGETACNGVHGRNRLASNSLLESLVFAKRAAQDMTAGYAKVKRCANAFAGISEEQYLDPERLAAEYRKMVRRKIKEADLAEERKEACMIR